MARGLLKQRSVSRPWARLAGAALVTGCMLTAGTALRTSAEITAGVIADGTCAVQGTMTFSPPAGPVPVAGTLVTVSVANVGGTPCASFPTGLVTSISVSGFATSSCAADVLSSVGGSVSFPGSNLPTFFVSGPYVGGPSSAVLDLNSADASFVSTLDLAWSAPVTTATCPIASTSSVSVVGTFVFTSR